jgi:hypothetical protein
MNLTPHSTRIAAFCLALFAVNANADDKFRQLDELLPTPTTIRTASGAPGRAYWQQRADYKIRATLDETARAVTGSGTVTYHNNSPDTLSYLWVQLDQNMFRADSDNRAATSQPSRDAWAKAKSDTDGLTYDAMRFALESRTFDGGVTITSLTSSTWTSP